MKTLKIYLVASSDKVLRIKAFNIAKNPKYDENQHVLGAMVYKPFVKKSSDANSGDAITRVPTETVNLREINLLLKEKLCQTNNYLKYYTN